MALDSATNLIDLLVQNPDALAKEDLEKLCEEISRDTLDDKECQHNSWQNSEIFPGTVTTAFAEEMNENETKEAVRSIIQGKMERQMPGERRELDAMCSKTIAFNANVTPMGAAAGAASLHGEIQPHNLGSGDGRNCIMNRASGFLPLDRAGAFLHENTKANTAHETASSRIFSCAKASDFAGSKEEVKIATVRSTTVRENTPMGVFVGNSAPIAFAYPIESPFELRRIGGRIFSVQRPVLKYTVPCSEQAIATTEWLLDNFEENHLSTVPRSVMYQEYVRFFENDDEEKYFNQAVFGKMVRACFPNLTTRRLGVRGQSRYHYAGLGVKANSRYAGRMFVRGEGNVARAKSKSARLKHIRPQLNVAANVTIDSSGNEKNENVSEGLEIDKTCADAADFFASYPGIDALNVPAKVDIDCLKLLLAFYMSYNKKLLSLMKAMDNEDTKSHLENFASLLPVECFSILHLAFVGDIIRVYDGILYHQVSEYLLPDCLATLSTEFKVAVRKYAKAFVDWIPDDTVLNGLPAEVTFIRKFSATQWLEYVKRVTTLCHVSKEARNALKDNAVTKQLRADLQGVEFDDISFACSWCTGNGPRGSKNKDASTLRKYVSRFSALLKERACLERYISVLDEIVEECVSVLENSLTSTPSTFERQFLMKWAMFISKILTEITLKTSGSVGTFHLVSLLFGDYVNHALCTKREKTVLVQVAGTILKSCV